MFTLSAQLRTGNAQREDKPEYAHNPWIVPGVIRQAADHNAAKGRRGRAGKGTGGGIAAVPHGSGRVFNVQQHGAHKGDHAQQSRFNPNL
ncbi:hypothetical protein SDC9_124367 [bioreactor metagenome]|uniref:Uncharacterized protein n=1 Tax=bioreactor metagenome TaxID=1076179 RepID=A0A645CK98_9ZZZZ